MLESDRLASHTQDDGFREIQLNGKQLVFVFMAATVVSVVIFLCGVLVGRGVRGERETAPASAEAAPVEDIRAVSPESPKPPTVEPGDDPTKALPPPPPAGDAERGGAEIVKPGQDAEARPTSTSGAAPAAAAVASKAETSVSKAGAPVATVAAATPKAEPATAKAASPASKPTVPAPKPEPTPKAASVKAEPAPKSSNGLPAVDDPKRGWVIQVAAVKTRGEAEGLAKELGAKGYTAFVLSGNSNVFRVRVGGYKSKRDAEAVAAKLRKEERINPWVTR